MHTGVLAQNVDGAAQCFVTYCREGARRLGGHTYPDITVDYIGFGHTLAAARSGDHRQPRAVMNRSVSQLAGAGADFFVCADNTAHLVLDVAGPDLAIPGLHLGQLVAEAATTHGYHRVGILGTKLLVSSPLYPTWLEPREIAVERPADTDLDAIDAIIYTELVNGIVSDASRRRCSEIITRLVDQGCDAVALLSTELPSLVHPADSPLPILDSADIAARAALDTALGTRPLSSWRGGTHPALAIGPA